jgi:hypothetical protein
MSRYAVAWHSPSKTLAIIPGDAEAPTEDGVSMVGHLVYGAVGDIPDASTHPQVDQHLANLAARQGVSDYSLVTVVNGTDNERLDKFTQTGDRDKAAQLEKDEDAKVLNKRDGLGNVDHSEDTDDMQSAVDNSKTLQADIDAENEKVRLQQEKDDAKAAKDAAKLADEAKAGAEKAKTKTDAAPADKAGGEDGKA